MNGTFNGEDASSTLRKINANLKHGFFRGYDVINLIAHEIGHIIHRQNNSFSRLSASQKEREADRFAKHHWSNNKISKWRQENVIQHAQENGYNWYEL